MPDVLITDELFRHYSALGVGRVTQWTWEAVGLSRWSQADLDNLVALAAAQPVLSSPEPPPTPVTPAVQAPVQVAGPGGLAELDAWFLQQDKQTQFEFLVELVRYLMRVNPGLVAQLTASGATYQAPESAPAIVPEQFPGYDLGPQTFGPESLGYAYVPEQVV